MFNQLKMNLLKELRYYYQSPVILVSIFLNELMILFVFWYTAKAFVPNLQIFSGKAIDYFTFIVVGETVLRIPSFFITIISRDIKNAVLDGTFDNHLLLKTSPQYSFLIGGLSSSIFEILKVFLVLTLASTFFIMDVDLSSALLTIPTQLIAIFIFSGIGLFSVSILLMLKRGEAWLMKIVSIATILAGAYFPSTVLPYNLGNHLLYLSPFNLLMESTRKIISGDLNWEQYLIFNSTLIAWATILFTLGSYFFSQSIYHHKKSNRPFLYTS